MGCPVKNEQYLVFEKEYGPGQALGLWKNNGETIPTKEQVKNLLEPLPFETAAQRVYNGFKGSLKEVRVGTRGDWQGFTTRTGTQVSQLAHRMQEWIDGIPAFKSVRIEYQNGLINIRSSKKSDNTYYQLTSNKAIEHELQTIINRTVQGGQQEGNIGTALSIFGRSQTTGTGGQETGQDIKELWRKVQDRGLEYKGPELTTKDSLDGGSEHLAYKIGDKVIKIRYSIPIELMDTYLRTLIAYNETFPTVGYKLLGFTKFKESSGYYGSYTGNIVPVVEQNYVNKDKNYYEYSVIETVLNLMGFTQSGHLEFSNKDRSIIISDLYPRNIYFENGIPQFIDPILDIDDKILYGTPEEYKQPESPIKGLDNKVSAFIESLGGRVNQVQDIVVDGKRVSANAVSNVITRTIDYVQDKAQIDTLPEEAAHIWFHWLPADSVLREDMMKDIRKRPLYDEVMEQYKDNKYYQNPDGSVNEDKIAIEAIGKQIAGAIVGEYKDQRSKSLLQRLIQWIKSVFKGKTQDSYQQAAQDILSGNNDKLDQGAIKEANDKGEYYFQLSDEDKGIVESQMKRGTAIQQQVIKDVYLEPHSRIILDKESHIYSDLNIENPTVYTSVTTAISGKKDIEGYENNQEWGNDFDRVLSNIIQSKDIEPTPYTEDSVRNELVPYLTGIINGLRSDGSIALTQVIVADKESKIAGSIDLLLIDPFGNMKIIDLKTSWKSYKDSQYTKKYAVGEGAIIPGVLSKAQTQSIQVGVYSKLVELLGYRIAERRTYHILVQNKDGKVTGFTDEGMVQHPSSENETLVNKIVPTVYQGKDRLAELRGEAQPLRPDLITEKEKVANKEQLEQRVLNEILPAYNTWRDYLDNIQNEVGFIPKDESIRKVDDLLHYMEQEHNKEGGASRIYTKFLTTTQAHLNGIIKYLTDPEKIASDSYVKGLFLAMKYLQTFSGLFHTEKFADTHQQKLYQNVDQSLRDVNAVIVQAVKENAKTLIEGWSTNPIYTDKTPVTLPDGTETTKGEQALTAAVSRNKDVSQATMLADTIGNSGIPLLENLSKEIAAARAQVIESSNSIIDSIRTAGNNLMAAMGTKDPKILYDWIFQRDSKGKKNGQIISQLGTLYKNIQQQVTEPLFNLDGTWKEYIQGANLTAEQKQWNKDLYYLKKDRGDFLAPEITTGGEWTGNGYTNTVSSTDGDYHRLTDEFRKEREQFMRQDSAQYGKWVPKNEKDPAYIDWRAKNYDWQQWVGPVMAYNRKTKRSEPTGQVQVKQEYFIKKKNITSRMETNDGQLLWDSTYARIMRGTTAVDKAQKVFYEEYVGTMRKQVEKLPPGAMNWFNQGYIPMIGANWVQMLSSKDVTMASVITDQLKNFFEVTTYTNQSDNQKMGTSNQSIPIMFMGKLRDQKRVQDLQTEIANWSATRGNKTGEALKEWSRKRDELVEMLRRESSKMTAEQLHPDLVTGMEAFIRMSENFHIMSGIEDSVLSVKEQLKAMEFEKKNGKVVTGIESNAYRLYEHVLNSIFYGEQGTKSFTEQFINKIMKVTSAISIPLNIFGMLNNKFVARVNNRLDAIGSNFFSHKAYQEAITDYNLNQIPGYIKTRMEHAADSSYGDRKAGSQYDALEHKFQMVRHLNSNEGRVDFLSKIGGYAGYEAGEWEVQSLVGNAILRSIQMKYTGTDPNLQDVSVYDAHTFDPNTGHVTLKEGYKYLDKDGNVATDQKKAEHLIINRIHETNDRIHGNYDPANKIMIERNLVGKLILQFHKWVYPNFKQRFQSGKFDENLGGGMDIEGRYLSLLGFLKSLRKLGLSTDRWYELTDHQKSNLKKDLADVLYICSLFAFASIVRAATDGLGDDDPYTKRMRNWLLYQTDRGIQEVSIFVPGWGLVESFQLVQNPFAATSSIKNFAKLLHDSIQYPFVDDDQRYYQRGNFKGESKAWKDFKAVVPGFKEINTLENLYTINSFYLGK